MTPKERRDAQIELQDMALEMERPVRDERNADRMDRWRRAQFLRVVASELDRVPEEQ